ncbi:MAG TPA: hypothetical protein VF604_15980 [Pyrinomonadaceae bacterium]|jgi:hypothetical protein
MKKRILTALAAVLVFGLAAVVFAINQSQNHHSSSASSHCAMHKQNGSTVAEHTDSCCGMADCCKDGACSMGGACCKKDKDSCPMKQKDATANATTSVDMTNVTIVGDGENCCQPGADCCKGGACCHKNKKS